MPPIGYFQVYFFTLIIILLGFPDHVELPPLGTWCVVTCPVNIFATIKTKPFNLNEINEIYKKKTKKQTSPGFINKESKPFTIRAAVLVVFLCDIS